MIKIVVPNNNYSERQYVIDVIFGVFLRVPYSIEFADVDFWLIYLPTLLFKIEDSFFNTHRSPNTFLSIDNIPQSYHDDMVFGNTLLRLWGGGTYIRNSEEISVGNDIFAASFFFLSRWEEIVLKREKGIKADEKLPEDELFVIKKNLYKRCVVNEYVEFIRTILSEQKIQTKKNEFTPLLTHDVDRCYLSNERELCVNIKKMLERNESAKAYRILSDYLSYPSNYNPFDSFDLLMDLAESSGTKAHFYFKACESNESGYTYSLGDEFVGNTIAKICRRGHYVGLHASENTFHNLQQLRIEQRRLADKCPRYEKGGRNHLLMYDEIVYDNLDSVGMNYDNGLGFQYYNGFRASVCYAYPIFNVVERKTLHLMQLQFNIMDSVSIRRELSPNDFSEQISSILSEVKKYSGIFVSNWHSNLFLANGRQQFIDVYKSMMQQIGG